MLEKFKEDSLRKNTFRSRGGAFILKQKINMKDNIFIANKTNEQFKSRSGSTMADPPVHMPSPPWSRHFESAANSLRNKTSTAKSGLCVHQPLPVSPHLQTLRKAAFHSVLSSTWSGKHNPHPDVGWREDKQENGTLANSVESQLGSHTHSPSHQCTCTAHSAPVL